jgi:hypothetical protein
MALENLCTIFEGSWGQAIAEFNAANSVRRSQGVKEALGMQSSLNNVLGDVMSRAGWAGSDGRFSEGESWIRFSFRHSMSQGSDFFDAQKQLHGEGFNCVGLIYAPNQILTRISPRDGNSLCSFERASLEMREMEEMFPHLPIWLGRLTPTDYL